MIFSRISSPALVQHVDPVQNESHQTDGIDRSPGIPVSCLQLGMAPDSVDYDFPPENPVTKGRYPIVCWLCQDPCVCSIATICHCQCTHPADLFVDNCREKNVP